MTRIATMPMQRQFQALLMRQQQKLSDVAEQVASQKKVNDYAGMGADSSRVLVGRGLLDQIEAQGRVTSRVNASLSFYQSRINEIDTAMSALNAAITDALGTGNAPTMVSDAEATYAQFRAAINAADDGLPIFAGARTDSPPLKLYTLADTVGADPDLAFNNDETRITAQVAPGQSMQFGIVATDFGKPFIEAFRTIAELGALPARPTQAQLDQLAVAKTFIQDGLKQLRAADALNGRNQNRIDDVITRTKDREIVLKSAISDVEDANGAEIETELVARRNLLDSSLSAFKIINSVSLVDFLR
jgi:flagellar hook-associated protein 3 FlgL